MNFSKSQFFSSSQRCQQWLPLKSHQFRLRHLSQIIGINLSAPKKSELYFTLHATIMSAPFYTSERVSSNNPKWLEIGSSSFTNASAVAVVVRIWQHVPTADMDCVLLTWGVNFSGLVYVANKMVNIKPVWFTANTVIFHMNGGYFTSLDVIREQTTDVPNFIKEKHIHLQMPRNGLVPSYNIDKLRKLHSLQISIKKKTLDVQGIRDRIDAKYGPKKSFDDQPPSANVKTPTMPSSIRYAPQPLTMNSLHKLLQDKPTKLERQKIRVCQKDVEVYRFRNRLLVQEIDRKLASLRNLRKKHNLLLEEREEKNSDIMDRYYTLRREADKLKAFKKTAIQYKTMLTHNNNQLVHRRKQLLKQLLFIYPITCDGGKYYIQGIHFPNSDMLADCPDTGLSVALGYVAHIVTMCGVFLQVPLRYPVIHYGSRSTIIDNISPFVSDKDREFPLFSRGKEKIQYVYAVYLLNKDLAQLRWLLFMHTSDLRATLANLLDFLSNDRNYIQESVAVLQDKFSEKSEESRLRIVEQTRHSDLVFSKHKLPSLQSYPISLDHTDPLLISVKSDGIWERSSSPSNKIDCGDCGPEQGEILSVPETFLTEQRSSSVFRNFVEPVAHKVERKFLVQVNSTVETDYFAPKVSNGVTKESLQQEKVLPLDSVENATEMLCPNLNSASSMSYVNPSSEILESHMEKQVKQKHKRHVSRSEGSYTDDDSSSAHKLIHEAGSAPALGSPIATTESSLLSELENLQDGQEGFLQNWLNNEPSFVCSQENLCKGEINAANLHTLYDISCPESPLMARTDALLKTKSFNLVKPKH